MSAGGWFVVDCKGSLFKVADEDGAKHLAARNDREYLRLAPHRAVQLVELTPQLAAAGGVLSSLRECVGDTEEVIARHIEAYGETYRASRLAHMRDQLARANAAIAKATGAQN